MLPLFDWTKRGTRERNILVVKITLVELTTVLGAVPTQPFQFKPC